MSHTWEINDKDTMFYGRVQEVRRKRTSGKLEMSISYWSMDQIEDDGEDYDILPQEFFADVVLGDILVL